MKDTTRTIGSLAAAALLALATGVQAQSPFGRDLSSGQLERLMGIHTLGADSELGRGRPTDYVLAASSFREAALLGFPLSQYRLGRMYEHGIGVAQDFGRAYVWYALAARYGDRSAVEGRDAMAKRLDRDRLLAAQSELRVLAGEIL